MRDKMLKAHTALTPSPEAAALRENSNCRECRAGN
jgi:hypothetical protein